MFEALQTRGFEVLALHHAEAIVSVDFAEAISDLEIVLKAAELPVLELVAGGGGETKLTQRIRQGLAEKGWLKRNIEIIKKVKWDEASEPVEVAALSHEIDHVKAFPNGKVFALEIEWNNKDPFFDRDLENFKRLHSEGAISVGAIITRGASLHGEMREIILRFANENQINSFKDLEAFGYDPTRRQQREIEKRAEKTGSFREAWAQWFVSDKFGEATTHWKKLQDRVLRGVGNPCPLVLIGLPSSVVTFDYSAASTDEL
ncbi:MAG: BglII/BstYI family type II restriction endonuclease [Nitratireductor sp.]